ncbi:sigma-54 dependent transcriptional regulator [Azospirillum sp.]|uniref:sigma-54 interaction domain-containing protein n=1 Tax=Azospirillum sp. TaxID=34012 RepID=UPI002D351101|nr:sigma-54 dependent transcriptional regulator [Azospirillum sp.]HYD66199.1 sigma-54 dependent transcriptional regulator [Azospirillum sp.]
MFTMETAPDGRVLLRRPDDAPPAPVRATAMVFEDPASRALLRRMEQLAPTDADVLIIGETGTGKELVARHLHDCSGRRHRPFIAVNCGAIAETLVESELFGHEKGAFTGALSAKAGWFEAADGGTLFLDEIGDLPPAQQVKLLRVLQEREVVRVGSRRSIPVDVRVITATNVKLEEAVRTGRFRQDLYYRIKVGSLILPPLRDRPGDVLPLVDHFLTLYGRRLGRRAVRLAPDAVQALLDHDWPGNIRELENVVHTALVTAAGDMLTRADVQLSLPVDARTEQPCVAAALRGSFNALFEADVPDLFGRVTDALVRSAYEYCGGNQVQAAKMLGISRNVLRGHLARLGMIPARNR